MSRKSNPQQLSVLCSATFQERKRGDMQLK